MITDRQKEKARVFMEMHRNNKMFVIPNAWSAGSAYIFEKQGFKAVATSSAGIAYNLGCSDGEDISFDDLLWIVQKTTNRVDVPLSIDFERGYSETSDGIKANARKLLFAGAVGFNIEDGLPDGTLSPLDRQIEKIKALAELKRELDIDFVINARTCAYWLNVAEKHRIAVERGNAFIEAGADCVFIPGAIDQSTAAKLAEEINGPINIILNPVFNDFNKLEQIGVRRLSVGSGPVRYICEKTINIADDLYNGKVTEILKSNYSYEQANNYFRKDKA